MKEDVVRKTLLHTFLRLHKYTHGKWQHSVSEALRYRSIMQQSFNRQQADDIPIFGNGCSRFAAGFNWAGRVLDIRMAVP